MDNVFYELIVHFAFAYDAMLIFVVCIDIYKIHDMSDIGRGLENVIEGEACRAFYHVFGPSPNIADISRQLSCILFILQL